MISKALVVAIAGVLVLVARQLGYEISEEFLVTALILILSLIGVDVVELAAKKHVENLRSRGLWK
jgi:hypothetical protein